MGRIVKEGDLDRLCEIGTLSYLDRYFADFVARLAGRDVPEVSLAAALVSSQTRKGHICLDLALLAGEPLPDQGDTEPVLVCPRLEEWVEKLKESPMVAKPGEYKPLVLDGSFRLYLYRYWHYETSLAAFITDRASKAVEDLPSEKLQRGLARLFPGDDPASLDWQKIAAFCALTRKFCVISGGPGSGKTTAVGKILALFAELAAPRVPRIALTAPTGKAAARLQEAIEDVMRDLKPSDRVREAIPGEASTVHRLLGSVAESPYFRHNAKNPLPYDVVVVDEASMGDLALMSKLVQAVRDQTRLILLGDRNQLASVEAGAVLGDICGSGNRHGFSAGFSETLKSITECDVPGGEAAGDGLGIADCIVELRGSYRFGRESGIGTLSRAINAGDAHGGIALLKDGRYGDLSWHKLPIASRLFEIVRDRIIDGLRDYLGSRDVRNAFSAFNRFQILCAVREGPYGVVALNRLVARILQKERLTEPARGSYAGLPVLITRNDHGLGLYNGDIGIVLPDPDSDGELRVFFQVSDNTYRCIHSARLPEHEPAYAMTVHKSQGSEFDRVLLVLPEKDSPVLTRELIYTGITRARQRVELWSREDVLVEAVSRRIKRSSGLRDALWDKGTPRSFISSMDAH